MSLVAVCIVTIAITVSYQVNPGAVNSAAGFLLSPIQRAFTGAVNWIGDKTHAVFNLGSIVLENERLREEAEALRIENSRLKQVDKENERLSELLEVDRKYIVYPKVGATVIAKDPGNWYNTFLVDKGTKDGIEKNMAVLGAGGLIGRISEANYNYSKVLSVIDDMSGVAAKSARTDDTGYLKGDTYLMSEGLCRMEFIDAESEMAVGDEIVTSHLSDTYPAGITIGYITEIRLDAIGTKVAIVKPNIDFKHLETVLIIKQVFDKSTDSE